MKVTTEITRYNKSITELIIIFGFKINHFEEKNIYNRIYFKINM